MTSLITLLIACASAHEVSVYAGARSLSLSDRASELTPDRVTGVRLRLLQGEFVLLDRLIPLSEFDLRIAREVSLKLGWNRIEQVRAALQGHWLERVFIAFHDEHGHVITEGWLTAAEASPLLGLDWPMRAINWVCARVL